KKMCTSSLRLILITAALMVANSFPQEAFAEGTTQQEEGIATPLNLNKVIEGQLKGGEQHRYQVVVGEGQYIHLKVEQRGIDVVLLFYAPDGHELLRIDTPNGVNGTESLDFVAAHAGKYQMVIAPLDKSAQMGAYRICLTNLR